MTTLVDLFDPFGFLRDSINDRHDEYGGSIEHRTQLLFKVMQAVAGPIGGARGFPSFDYAALRSRVNGAWSGARSSAIPMSYAAACPPSANSTSL